jgi:hypothetical protein
LPKGNNMDWKAVVGSVAPWIGAALGGPLGSAAVGVVADALGLSDKTEGAIKQALSGVTPEQMMAIKNADQAFALKMQELGYANIKDMEALAVSDRSSARQREIAVKDNTPKILAYIITLGYFGILIAIMFGEVPAQSKDILYIMLGTLGTSWAGCIAYYFGSTAGSKQKTELLAASNPPKEMP